MGFVVLCLVVWGLITAGYEEAALQFSGVTLVGSLIGNPIVICALTISDINRKSGASESLSKYGISCGMIALNLLFIVLFTSLLAVLML